MTTSLLTLSIGLATATTLATLTYVPPLLIRLRQVVWMRRHLRGKLALTFDDGPDAILTVALLDLLARHNVKATFFLVGWRAKEQPHVCDRLVQAGHDIGSHSHRHCNQWKVWPWDGIRDIEQSYETLSRWIGSDAPFRPPKGKLTTWGWLAIRRRRSLPVWWTHAAGDTYSPLPSAEEVCRRVSANRGGVLLLHARHGEPERNSFVLDLTERLILLARREDIELCPLFRAIGCGSDSKPGPARERTP